MRARTREISHGSHAKQYSTKLPQGLHLQLLWHINWKGPSKHLLFDFLTSAAAHVRLIACCRATDPNRLLCYPGTRPTNEAFITRACLLLRLALREL